MLARRIDLSGRDGDLPGSVVVLELALATKQRAGSDAWEARREATQSVVMRRSGVETVRRRVRYFQFQTCQRGSHVQLANGVYFALRLLRASQFAQHFTAERRMSRG